MDTAVAAQTARVATVAPGFGELHWSCGHTTTSPVIGTSHDNPHRDRPCFDCQQAQRITARAAAAKTGPMATARQIGYLRDLIGQAASLPAGCPTDPTVLTREQASTWITRLKTAPRRAATTTLTRCECASGRFGGVCTCD